VERVIYPTLHKGELGDRAKRYFKGGNGALVGIEVKGGVQAGKKFIENSLLASHLANVGDAKTLVIHPASTTHQQMKKEDLEHAGIKENLIRISVGIEDISDITNDLNNSLKASQRA